MASSKAGDPFTHSSESHSHFTGDTNHVGSSSADGIHSDPEERGEKDHGGKDNQRSAAGNGNRPTSGSSHTHRVQEEAECGCTTVDVSTPLARRGSRRGADPYSADPDTDADRRNTTTPSPAPSPEARVGERPGDGRSEEPLLVVSSAAGADANGDGTGATGTPSTTAGNAEEEDKEGDGLEDGERTRMTILMRILFCIGALQFAGAVAATIVIRVFEALNGCIDPTDFDIPYDFEHFKRTGDFCYLGYGLLFCLSWAPQVPMVFSAPLNIIGGFTHYWYLSLGGIALHSLITLGMVGILLAILITGWPFWTYVLPFIIFTILSGLGIPLLVMLSFPWKKMKVIMDRKFEREREKERLRQAAANEGGAPGVVGSAEQAPSDDITGAASSVRESAPAS